MNSSVRRAVQDAGYDYACGVVAKISELGIMALPRLTPSESDGSAGMAAKKTFFRGLMAAKGMKKAICEVAG
jgi:hypothetical protein